MISRSIFLKNQKDEDALLRLKEAIIYDPRFSDAYEMLGVILGRHEKYDEAIRYMDKLEEISPDSIMAHTNKSLFYMKQGKIELAEDEKAKATVKNFERLGRESKEKRNLEKEKADAEKQMKERESMFLEVLSIDESDAFANYGLGEINYKKGTLKEAKEYSLKTISLDEKYSNAYLLLGKIHFDLKELTEASKILEKGIEVATQKGEIASANQMQSILNSIDC